MLFSRLMRGRSGQAAAAAVGLAVTGALLTAAVPATYAAVQQQVLQITRANLAKSATFTVVQTLVPKGGSKSSTVYKVEVSGNKARLDFQSADIGSVRYIANEKGVFFYTPASQLAVKQSFKGGVEGALRVTFSQVNEQLKRAKKVGTSTVSGMPTDVYKDAQSGTMIYVSRKPGFRLPVKTVLSNAGGTRTLLVQNIKLNAKVPEARFAIPAGTQIVDQTASGGGAPLGAGR